MGFLQKTKHCNHISLSLGSVAINRGLIRYSMQNFDSIEVIQHGFLDLRTMFDRLGLKRAFAYENQGASVVVRLVRSQFFTSYLLTNEANEHCLTC